MSSSVTATTYPTAANDATESKLESWAGVFATNGVISGAGNQLATFADSTGMHVKLPSGSMMIGVRGDLASQTTLDIATADATNPRIDTVVGELTRTPSPYVIKYKVITGVAASSPVAPTLTNNATTLQIALADVRVDAGVTTIAAGKITDRRTYANNPTWYQVGASGLPAFEHSWVNYGTGGYAPVSFCIDGFGFVHLRGLAKNGTMSQSIFTLPSGFQPIYKQLFTVTSNSQWDNVTVDSAGAVVADAGSGSNAYVSLDGISFSVRA